MGGYQLLQLVDLVCDQPLHVLNVLLAEEGCK